MKTEMNPPVKSKINWTAIGTAAMSIAALFIPDITPESKAAIIASIATLGSALTVVWRTLFTDPTAV